jgi:hypothetical protein
MTQEKQPAQQQPATKPNDKGGFYFSSHLTIKDPNTQQVLVKMRAD